MKAFIAMVLGLLLGGVVAEAGLPNASISLKRI